MKLLNNSRRPAFIFFIVAICLSACFSVAGQNKTERFEISGGYAYTNAQQLFESPPVAHGWYAGGGYRVTKKVSVYGEFDQDRGSQETGGSVTLNGTRTTVLGGLRYHFINKSRVTPFVNAGLGYLRFSVTVHLVNSVKTYTNDPTLAIAAGGGFDVELNKKGTINWRNSGEYRRVEAGEIFKNNMFFSNSRNAFRFSSGLVVRF